MNKERIVAPGEKIKDFLKRIAQSDVAPGAVFLRGLYYAGIREVGTGIFLYVHSEDIFNKREEAEKRAVEIFENAIVMISEV